eukprot:GAHX01004080.1.p1 GENE.GAHX01004080.1~~GAHX01004080.1.p1  ORF type:complete len:416 (+),score=80.13 GAHX01004080.1:233-1480(+)
MRTTIQLSLGNAHFENISDSYLIYSAPDSNNQSEHVENKKKSSDINEDLLEQLKVVSILFQHGVLTIKDSKQKLVNQQSIVISEEEKQAYQKKPSDYPFFKRKYVHTLGFPNQEIPELLCKANQIHTIIKNAIDKEEEETKFGLEKLIEEGDWNTFFKLIYFKIFGKTPHFSIFDGLKEASYFVNLTWSFLRDKLKIKFEETVNKGRFDLAIVTKNKILVIELKAGSKPPQRAFEQCTKYATGLWDPNKSLVICGLCINHGYMKVAAGTDENNREKRKKVNTKDRASFRNIHGFYLKELKKGSASIGDAVNSCKGKFKDNKIVECKELTERGSYGGPSENSNDEPSDGLLSKKENEKRINAISLKEKKTTDDNNQGSSSNNDEEEEESNTNQQKQVAKNKGNRRKKGNNKKAKTN